MQRRIKMDLSPETEKRSGPPRPLRPEPPLWRISDDRGPIIERNLAAETGPELDFDRVIARAHIRANEIHGMIGHVTRGAVRSEIVVAGQADGRAVQHGLYHQQVAWRGRAFTRE